MSTHTLRIRMARADDAEGVARVHDEAWTEAYRGIIPGRDLTRIIARRGPRWWQTVIRRGARIAVLDFGDTLAGYASFGRNRAPSLPHRGEIFELYIKPEFQGLGFGRRLFAQTRLELSRSGLTSTVVWCLADNERAVGFYDAMGGILVGRAHETFEGHRRERIAFGWQ